MIFPAVVRISVDTGTGQSIGTGVVYDTDGRILTNWHVIQDAVSISVTKPDETVVPASLFRASPENDIALVSIEDGTGLEPPPFGERSSLNTGDDVIAIGYALGLSGPPTLSRGVISGLDRVLANGVGGELTGLIQTDAAINNGNSGGPLVDVTGKVIGINTAKLSSGDRIGFAINIDNVLQTAAALIELGPVPPPGFLGLAGRTLFRSEAISLGLPLAGGFLIQVVGPNTPAADAGVVENDVLVQMNTAPILGEPDFTEFLNTNPAGTSVRIFAWRLVQGTGWDPVVIDATLGERP